MPRIAPFGLLRFTLRVGRVFQRASPMSSTGSDTTSCPDALPAVIATGTWFGFAPVVASFFFGVVAWGTGVTVVAAVGSLTCPVLVGDIISMGCAVAVAIEAATAIGAATGGCAAVFVGCLGAEETGTGKTGTAAAGGCWAAVCCFFLPWLLRERVAGADAGGQCSQRCGLGGLCGRDNRALLYDSGPGLHDHARHKDAECLRELLDGLEAAGRVQASSPPSRRFRATAKYWG